MHYLAVMKDIGWLDLLHEHALSQANGQGMKQRVKVGVMYTHTLVLDQIITIALLRYNKFGVHSSHTIYK